MNECKKGHWGGGDFILVAKNIGGIISTYTKMTRGDSFWGGFCPYPIIFCSFELSNLKSKRTRGPSICKFLTPISL